MVALTIDNLAVEVPEGTTILEAARSVGIHIPSLCTIPEIHHSPGACRVCVVEVDRARTLVASCVYPVANGMKVKTNSRRVREARERVIEFLLSDHPPGLQYLPEAWQCELQQVAEQVGTREITVPRTDFTVHDIDDTSEALVRDTSKCINCLRCVTVCSEVQGVSCSHPKRADLIPGWCRPWAITWPIPPAPFAASAPWSAPRAPLLKKTIQALVWAALEDPTKHVVVQEARPSGRSWARNSECPPARW
jgi:ferredoxin